MATLDLAFACPSCGQAVEDALSTETAALTCGHCESTTPLPEAAATLAATPIGPCCVCGSDDLYRQKDFSRKAGLALAAIGLLFGPWTHWISAIVAVAIDAILYLIVPTVTICYACNAQYRGVSKERRREVFDIAIHDVYKFNRRHPPRRDVAVAGPLQIRLRNKGETP